MSFLIDSYTETNHNGIFVSIDGVSGHTNFLGTSFACSTAGFLSYCQFYLKRSAIATGFITAKLYATTGSFGSTSTPTGPVLSTSNPVNVNSLDTVPSLIIFNFTDRFTLVSGVNYCIVLDGMSRIGGNTISWGEGLGTSYHGNRFTSLDGGSTFSTSTSVALCFYVYGDTIPYSGDGLARRMDRISQWYKNVTRRAY